MRIENEGIGYEDADRPTYEGKLFTGTVFETYKNGAIASEVDFENGLRSGYYKLYYSNGRLAKKEHYARGAREGLSRSWYESGALRSESAYSDQPRPGTLLFLRTWDEIGRETTA